MRVDFQFAGDKQVSREILRVGERAGNMMPAFAMVAKNVMSWTGEQFDSQGGRASGGWAPLSEATLERKSRLGQDMRILRATGDLEASLTRVGARGQILKLSPTQLVFGSSIEYFQFHQRGTSKMPRRRPLEFTERDRRDIVKTLQAWAVRGQLR